MEQDEEAILTDYVSHQSWPMQEHDCFRQQPLSVSSLFPEQSRTTCIKFWVPLNGLQENRKVSPIYGGGISLIKSLFYLQFFTGYKAGWTVEPVFSHGVPQSSSI